MEDPENPWAAAMRRGDFEAAWRISDEFLRSRAGKPCWDWPRHLQYVWDGSPLEGRRVLVRCYHGLGDTLQFIRYIPRLAALARNVVVWAQPPLIPLLRTLRAPVEWLPLHDGVPEAEHDVDVELMELPRVFRTTLRDLPADVPYLHAAPAGDVVNSRPDELQAGVVWRCGGWDERRSSGVEAARAWREIPGVRLHCLQRGEARVEWNPSWGPDSGSDDVVRTASVMRALDLIITVDSMPAHLAGALGVPVWTLLHANADWRWMTHRPDSPWYPSMRLFRQRASGDWNAVIEAVAEALRREVARNPTKGRAMREPHRAPSGG
jgi:hypothetical protein